MKDNTLDIKTVCECNRCLGCKTLHPQVSIINLENPSVYQDAVKFEFYAILLIEDCEGDCDCCGRKYYDYSNATMVFLTPGEIFRMNKNSNVSNNPAAIRCDGTRWYCYAYQWNDEVHHQYSQGNTSLWPFRAVTDATPPPCGRKRKYSCRYDSLT